MKNKKSSDYLEINYLFLFIRDIITTANRVTRRTNNINGNRVGILKPIPIKNRHIITTINVSMNSFIPNGLPNSSFIFTRDYLRSYLLNGSENLSILFELQNGQINKPDNSSKYIPQLLQCHLIFKSSFHYRFVSRYIISFSCLGGYQ